MALRQKDVTISNVDMLSYVTMAAGMTFV